MGTLVATILPSSANAQVGPGSGGGPRDGTGGGGGGSGPGGGGGGGGPPGSGGGGSFCFLCGTSILTPTGEVRIEDLQVGDLVVTVRGEALPVMWIGRQTYRRSGTFWPESVMPIRIARQALDGQTPHKDLYLSPDHALFIDGVLIRAKELVTASRLLPLFSLRVR